MSYRMEPPSPVFGRCGECNESEEDHVPITTRDGQTYRLCRSERLIRGCDDECPNIHDGLVFTRENGLTCPRALDHEYDEVRRGDYV